MTDQLGARLLGFLADFTCDVVGVTSRRLSACRGLQQPKDVGSNFPARLGEMSDARKH